MFFLYVCPKPVLVHHRFSPWKTQTRESFLVFCLLSSIFCLLSSIFCLLSSCSGWHEDQSVGLIDPDAAGDGDGTGGDEDGGATLARSRSAKLSAKAGFTIIEKTEVRRRRNALSLSLCLFLGFFFSSPSFSGDENRRRLYQDRLGTDGRKEDKTSQSKEDVLFLFLFRFASFRFVSRSCSTNGSS